MDTDSFIVHIKTDDTLKDIAGDVETRFDISNYELESNYIERPLPKGKNKINSINKRWIRPKNHDKVWRMKIKKQKA